MPITRSEKLVIILISFLILSFLYYVLVTQKEYDWEFFEGLGFITFHFFKLLAVFALINYLFKKIKHKSLI